MHFGQNMGMFGLGGGMQAFGMGGPINNPFVN